jgi:hypothetical protein
VCGARSDTRLGKQRRDHRGDKVAQLALIGAHLPVQQADLARQAAQGLAQCPLGRTVASQHSHNSAGGGLPWG